MQHITIKNFGPLVDVDIDLPDVMLLIGAQASGKSTLAKLVHFFRSLPQNYIDFLNDDTIKFSQESVLEKELTHKVLSNFEVIKQMMESNFLHANTEITYFYNKDNKDAFAKQTGVDWSLPFTRLTDPIVFNYKSKYENSTTKPNFALLAQEEIDDWNREKEQAKQKAINAIRDIFSSHHTPQFIPANRGIAAFLPNILGSKDAKDLDENFKTFLQEINNLRPSFSYSLEKLIVLKKQRMNGRMNAKTVSFAEKVIPIIQEKILKAKYGYDNSKGEFLTLENGEMVRFSQASSGQQEANWITLLLFTLILNERKTALVIEEPEAHLYPVAQLEMVKIIALLSNVLTGEDANQIMITTHSPYILTALNLLLYAHKVGQQQPESVHKMIAKEFWLDKNRVAAYEVKDGILHNILDADIVHADRIDTASEKINALFDKLLNMDEL